MKRIAGGASGSSGGLTAVDWAVEAAAPRGARLQSVNVCLWEGEQIVAVRQPREVLEEQALALREKARQRARAGHPGVVIAAERTAGAPPDFCRPAHPASSRRRWAHTAPASATARQRMPTDTPLLIGMAGLGPTCSNRAQGLMRAGRRRPPARRVHGQVLSVDARRVRRPRRKEELT
ncbi:universal stress protein [Streptomyces sp. NPDC046324]|uniref:universal stress protein n=1 Tax=Streptomyces sp. NPDC046324 TaxID=3154915 RepID=UPI0033E0F42C